MRRVLTLIKGKYGYITGVKFRKTKRLRWDEYEAYETKAT